jgi:hypothetical protein
MSVGILIEWLDSNDEIQDALLFDSLTFHRLLEMGFEFQNAIISVATLDNYKALQDDLWEAEEA